MFASSHRRAAGSNANRWLLLAGAGLLVLGFVLRLMIDIGRTTPTATGDSPAARPAPDTTSLAAATPPTTQPPIVPDTAPAVPTTPPVAPAPASYAVQLGLFAQHANAAAMALRAERLGYRPVLMKEQRGARTVYTVRIEELGSAAHAKGVADSVNRALGINAVVSPPR